MRPPPHPGLLLVAIREIRFFRRDRAGWFLIVVIPLISFAILAWTFSSAVVRGLNVVIVDMDRSAASNNFIDQIAAAPGVRITQRAESLTTATQAIRSGMAIAAVYVPLSFERDLLAGRRPQIIASTTRSISRQAISLQRRCATQFPRPRRVSRRCARSDCSRSGAALLSSSNMS